MYASSDQEMQDRHFWCDLPSSHCYYCRSNISEHSTPTILFGCARRNTARSSFRSGSAAPICNPHIHCTNDRSLSTYPQSSLGQSKAVCRRILATLPTISHHHSWCLASSPPKKTSRYQRKKHNLFTALQTSSSAVELDHDFSSSYGPYDRNDYYCGVQYSSACSSSIWRPYPCSYIAQKTPYNGNAPPSSDPNRVKGDRFIIPSLGRLLHLYRNADMGNLSSIQGTKLFVCFDSYNEGSVVCSNGWSNFPSADVYLGARQDSLGHGRISAKRSHCSKEYRGTRRHGQN
jgi:hypothetical protein